MVGHKKLGMDSAHRKAVLRNQVTDLFRDGRIQTTKDKAKETGRAAEKMITFAKKGDLAAKRKIFAYIYMMKMLQISSSKKLDPNTAIDRADTHES